MISTEYENLGNGLHLLKVDSPPRISSASEYCPSTGRTWIYKESIDGVTSKTLFKNSWLTCGLPMGQIVWKYMQRHLTNKENSTFFLIFLKQEYS